jgi:Bacteriophage baseplate protein W
MPTGAITLADLSSADWSLELDSSTSTGGVMAGFGNVVQGVADVNQCIAIILGTPRGADPLRPTFGADLWQYIDYPIQAAIPAIVREVTQAITLWEPRVKLLAVRAALVANDASSNLNAHLQITIVWQLKLQSGVPSPQTVAITIPARLS